MKTAYLLALTLGVLALAASPPPNCPVVNSTLIEAGLTPSSTQLPVSISLNFLGIPTPSSPLFVYIIGATTYIAQHRTGAAYGLKEGSALVAGSPLPTDGRFYVNINLIYYNYTYDIYYVSYNCSGNIKNGTLAVIKSSSLSTYSISVAEPITQTWAEAWTFSIPGPYTSLPATWYQGPDVSDQMYVEVGVTEPTTLSGLSAGRTNSGPLGVKVPVASTTLVLGDDARGLPQGSPFTTRYSPSYFSWSPEGRSGVLSGSMPLTSQYPSSVSLNAWFVPASWSKPLVIKSPNAPGVVALPTSFILLNQTVEGRVALFDSSYNVVAETYISQWGGFAQAVSHLLAEATPSELPSYGPFALSPIGQGSGGWDYYALYTYLEWPVDALWEPYVLLGPDEIWVEGGSLSIYLPEGGVADFYASLYGYLVYGGHYLGYLPGKYDGLMGYIVESPLGRNVAWNGAVGAGNLMETEVGSGNTTVLAPWSYPMPDSAASDVAGTYGLAMRYSRWSYLKSPQYIWASLTDGYYEGWTTAVDPVTGTSGTARGVVYPLPPYASSTAYPADMYIAVSKPWGSGNRAPDYIATVIANGPSGRPAGVLLWSLVPLVPCRSLYCLNPREAWWNGKFAGNSALEGAPYGLAVKWLGNSPITVSIYVAAASARYVNGTWAGPAWPSSSAYNISLGTFTLIPNAIYVVVPGSAALLPNASQCELAPVPPGWFLAPTQKGVYWVEFATQQGVVRSYYYTTGISLNYTVTNDFSRLLRPSALFRAYFCQLINGTTAYPASLLAWFPYGCLKLGWTPLSIYQGPFEYWEAGCHAGDAQIEGNLEPYGDLRVRLGSIDLFDAKIKYIDIKPIIEVNRTGIYIYVPDNLSKYIDGFYIYLFRNGSWVKSYYCPGRDVHMPWAVADGLAAYPWDPAEVVPAINYTSTAGGLTYPVPLWAVLANWWSLPPYQDGYSDLKALEAIGCQKA